MPVDVTANLLFPLIIDVVSRILLKRSLC